MLTQEFLPERLVARCLDILRTLSPSERDLIRVVVEVVHEVRDIGKDEEPEVSGPAERSPDPPRPYSPVLCHSLPVQMTRHSSAMTIE
jgi:hypothetical protein